MVAGRDTSIERTPDSSEVCRGISEAALQFSLCAFG
jgi:hypothetical protein